MDSRRNELIWDIAICKAYLSHIRVPEFMNMIAETIKLLQKELDELEGDNGDDV